MAVYVGFTIGVLLDVGVGVNELVGVILLNEVVDVGVAIGVLVLGIILGLGVAVTTSVVFAVTITVGLAVDFGFSTEPYG